MIFNIIYNNIIYLNILYLIQYIRTISNIYTTIFKCIMFLLLLKTNVLSLFLTYINAQIYTVNPK